MSSPRHARPNPRGARLAKSTGQPARERELELEVEHAAPGGAFVARTESGEVAFVTGAAPGERVRAEVARRAGALHGRVLAVLRASPARRAPECPVATRCGGCDWLHLDEATQAREHVAIVEAAFGRALAGAALPPVRSHAAVAPLAYRHRARLHVAAKGGQASAGYREAGSHAIVDARACAVLEPRLRDVVARVGSWLHGARGSGEVAIALGANGAPVLDARFDESSEPPAALYAKLDQAVLAGELAGARVTLEGMRSPAVFGDARIVTAGADGAPLRLAAGGFAQASEAGGVALARFVAEACAGAGASGTKPRVVELFAGSGTLSVALAPVASSLVAVEVDPAAADAARESLRERGHAHAKVTCADAEAWTIPANTDVVVLDPPRAGAPGATRAIAASRVKRVVYVACDPPAAARDVATLVAAGWTLESLDAFELFPQTSHVEVVCVLARRRPAKP